MVEHIGPMPEPRIESGDPPPGGVDAVTAPTQAPIVPDLPAELTPVRRAVPPEFLPELSLGEDTSTQATADGQEPMSGEQESPA